MSTVVDLNPGPVPPGAVVLHVDEAAAHEHARSWAVEQALAERRPLVLVAMTPTAPGTAPTLRRERERAEQLLDAMAEQIRRDHTRLDLHSLVVSADSVPTLLELSEDAALVVIGAHSHVWSSLAGSWGVDASVAARTACPVVVVPRRHRRVSRGVLVGVDLGERSGEVLDFAFRQASLHRLPLTVLACALHAADVEEDVRRLAEVAAGFRERFPDVHVTREVRHGRPAHELVSAADRMDLLVVGRHRPTGLSASPFGHVRGGVVDRAHCPVAVVPVTS